MLTLLKFLIYALAAVVILTLVLSNSHIVAFELFILPPLAVPLYAPIVLAFAIGLLIGLLYSAKIALFRTTRKPDSGA